MKKELVSMICVAALLGATTSAFAGAYGKAPEGEEGPSVAPAPPPQPVEAEEEGNYGRPGAYLEVGGVYAIENFGENKLENKADVLIDNTDVDTNIKIDNTGGYQLRAGYRINEWVAAELEWEHIINYAAKGQADWYDGARIYDSASAKADLSTYALTANAKFFPLPGRFQPYALVGAGWLNVQSDQEQYKFEGDDAWTGASEYGIDEDSFGMRFGLGLDAYITDEVGVAAEVGYVLPLTGNMADYDIEYVPMSLSLFYRFD